MSQIIPFKTRKPVTQSRNPAIIEKMIDGKLGNVPLYKPNTGGRVDRQADVSAVAASPRS